MKSSPIGSMKIQLFETSLEISLKTQLLGLVLYGAGLSRSLTGLPHLLYIVEVKWQVLHRICHCKVET